MATLVEYTGPDQIREVRDTDFAAAGFVSQPTTVWNKANNYERSVPDDVAVWLLAQGGFAVENTPNYSAALQIYRDPPSRTGFYSPQEGLFRFGTSDRALRHIVFYGDSTFDGNNGDAGGGIDRPSEWLRRAMLSRLGNTLIHYGFIPMWQNAGKTRGVEIVYSGTWAQAPAAQQLIPHNPTAGSGNAVRQVSTSGATCTWTRPSGVKCTEFDIWYVQGTGSAAEASYRVDAGAWTAIPINNTGGPVLNRLTVTGVNDPTTIQIRGANAAGTAALWWPAGFSIRGGNTGWVVQNMGKAGASMVTGSTPSIEFPSGPRDGDFGAWFDIIQPELIVVNFTNDVVMSPFVIEDFMSGVQTFYDRVKNYSDILWFGMMPQWSALGTRPPANQTAIRNSLMAFCEANPGNSYIDFGKRWGVADTPGTIFPGLVAKGYYRNEGTEFFPGYIHPIENGAREIGMAVDRFLRTAA